jgi:hypothetical protein
LALSNERARDLGYHEVFRPPEFAVSGLRKLRRGDCSGTHERMSISTKIEGTIQRANISRGLLPARWSRFAGPAVILFAAAIAAAPIWIHGATGADDVDFHLISWLDAQHSWLSGIIYPHWAPSPNFGAGEPRFIFYPPLTWMLGAALGLVLPWGLVPFAMVFLLLAGTGLATRALARQMLPDAPATLAGCAALFSGYALFTAYERLAVGELCGGCWIPLLLLFALRDRNLSAPTWRTALDGSTLPLALVTAACWLSDAPVGVMASYLLAAVALAAAITARSWFPVVRASIAFVSGVALAGFYLIPAAWEQRWVDILQATGVNGDPGLTIENNWLFPHHQDPALKLHDYTLRFISPIAVSMLAVASVSLIVLWLSGRISVARRGAATAHARDANAARERISPSWWIPLALILPIVLFLLLPVSLPVWNLFPKLRFLQFPWRWVLVVEAPMSVFFAAAVWVGMSRGRWLRNALPSICALLFVATTLFAMQNFFRDDPRASSLNTILSKYKSGAGFVGTDEYASPGSDNSMVATRLPDACLADNFDTELGIAPNPVDNPAWRADQGSCRSTATAQLRQAEHMRIETVAPRAGFLILRLRRYPAWRVTLNKQLVSNIPVRDDGLIAVPVSQGPVEVSVDWAATPDVIAGRCVSVLALLAIIAVGLTERKLRRKPQS